MDKETILQITRRIREDYKINCKIQNQIPGGWMNRKWKASSDQGELVIKELSKERYKGVKLEGVKKALAVQYAICKRVDCVPEVLKANNRIVQEDDAFSYMLMSCVQGEHRSEKTVTGNELFRLGKALALLHEENVSTVYPVAEVQDDHLHNLRSHISKMARSSNQRICQLYDPIRQISKTIESDFFEGMEVGFTHSDFTNDNILFSGGEPKILDFDRGRIGYQLQDVGRAIMTFTFNGEHIKADKAGRFIDGYRTLRKLSTEDVCKSLRLIWLIEVPWWIQEPMFDPNVKEKLRAFREEIVWITRHFGMLEQAFND